MSLNGFAISTANLYAGAQPGGALFGLALSAPPNPAVLYSGDPTQFGSASDPFVGKSLGGVITFGGGLALYDGKSVVGALGVSGDTSCADHNIAWRVRQALGLDKVPAGVGPDHNDEIIYDLAPDKIERFRLWPRFVQGQGTRDRRADSCRLRAALGEGDQVKSHSLDTRSAARLAPALVAVRPRDRSWRPVRARLTSRR